MFNENTEGTELDHLYDMLRKLEDKVEQQGKDIKRQEILIDALVRHTSLPVPTVCSIGPKTNPEVKAICYSWDWKGTYTCNFDCRLWLEFASDKDLVDLAANKNNPSIGEYYKDTLTKEVFDYLEEEESTNTRVHAGQLYEWISINRPHLLKLGVSKPNIDSL